MARYALIKDGVVVNVIEWDGISSWTPPEGYELVLDDGGKAEPEGTYDGQQFIVRVKPLTNSRRSKKPDKEEAK